MRPSSTQACSTGKTLSGLSCELASKAHLTRCCCARSASENISPIRRLLLDADAMFTGQHAAHLTQSLRMSAPKASARSSSPSRMQSNTISGWRLPSPAWKTLQQSGRSDRIARDLFQHFGQRRARNGTIHAQHVGFQAVPWRRKPICALTRRAHVPARRNSRECGGAAMPGDGRNRAHLNRRLPPACRRVRRSGWLRRRFG